MKAALFEVSNEKPVRLRRGGGLEEVLLRDNKDYRREFNLFYMGTKTPFWVYCYTSAAFKSI